jgi:endoglucanase
MNIAMSRERVKGFLDVKGKQIVNEAGEEIILTGWGLGNWLLCEGYMWKSAGAKRFDRPRRIETVIEELTGNDYADKFWKSFRKNYITEDDIRHMAELGYNSVRIPINSRLFLKEEPGINFVNEGFELLDQCIDWCEKYHLYAFIDLHGAPGGQTGANIDDCIDDVPRLFLDQDCFDKGIALWTELAARYKDRWIVGGYDLLNEPIRPKSPQAETDYDYLVTMLVKFYETAIEEIRKIDQKHLFSIEGHHWATAANIFCKKYDEKMIIHFHRYATIPDISCYQEWLALSDQWNLPLWLGETGENYPEWFTAMYPLAADLGIGYNLWPWKKMDCFNSPCSVKLPDDWDKIIDYAKGGPHPGYQAAQLVLDQYLENMKFDNCDKLDTVAQAAFRRPGCIIRGTDFDHFPGKGFSYSGLRNEDNLYRYRLNTGMNIVNEYPELPLKFGFDCGFKRYVLGLAKDEFAVYSIHDVKDGDSFRIKFICTKSSVFEIYQNDVLLHTVNVSHDNHSETAGCLHSQIQDGLNETASLLFTETGDIKIKLITIQGEVKIEAIETLPLQKTNE